MLLFMNLTAANTFKIRYYVDIIAVRILWE